MAREAAPEHGRVTYGEPDIGLVPAEIYRKEHAIELLDKGRKSKTLAEKILVKLGLRV